MSLINLKISTKIYKTMIVFIGWEKNFDINEAKKLSGIVSGRNKLVLVLLS